MLGTRDLRHQFLDQKQNIGLRAPLRKPAGARPPDSLPALNALRLLYPLNERILRRARGH